MKLRDVVIFSGHSFSVPQCIQRIDTRATHGWQVRYNGTKFFSDKDAEGVGAAQSLIAATQELVRRIAEQPAPTNVNATPCVHKTSDLPSGISGPMIRSRPGRRSRVVELSVNLPRFAQAPKRRSVYIGTEQAYTQQRFDAALSKAIALRTEAERIYQEEATRHRRLSALSLQALGGNVDALIEAIKPKDEPATDAPAAPDAAATMAVAPPPKAIRKTPAVPRKRASAASKSATA
jgi:hypothetical protein